MRGLRERQLLQPNPFEVQGQRICARYGERVSPDPRVLHHGLASVRLASIVTDACNCIMFLVLLPPSTNSALAVSALTVVAVLELEAPARCSWGARLCENWALIARCVRNYGPRHVSARGLLNQTLA
ncbi:unnamed protein product [Prorocentrum cordatum]|uniref:Uncharacterized protein n=1 Tax=Prorocentrum cordatum TaxID=2364126 RepID=A0ABN9VBA9_9DINO|nr:unnamed protein product [Polarella glacialis]